MNQEIVESIHQAITPGECMDLYYPGEENCHKQCFSALLDNRFIIDLNSKTSGSTSTVLFNPEQGVSHLVLTLQLPAATGALTYNGLGLPVAWGYSAIKNIALRVGGSSLYYFTGDQMFVDVMSDCEDSRKRDQMAFLGGQSCVSTSDFADANKRTAYVYVKLPFNSPSAQEATLPLPTDLLTQPVQVLIEFANFSSIFVQNSAVAGTLSPVPTEFAVAQVCFRQTHLTDQGMLLARRENMNEKALSYPLRYFPQTTFKTTLQNPAGGQDIQINLTGFRSGSVKEILIWAVKNSDLQGGNPLKFVPLGGVKLLVNGLVYYDGRLNSNQLWSLIDRKTSASTDITVVAPDPANAALLKASDYATPWVVIPFSQRTEVLAGENDVVSGLPIMNSVVNLSVQFPAGIASGDYTICAEYRYVSSLMFSKGSAEYIF